MTDDQLPPTIADEAQYERVRAIADDLADQVGDDENHVLYSKFLAAMELMEVWEKEHVQLPAANGCDVLRYLMEAHNLKFSDLHETSSKKMLHGILGNRQEISPDLAVELGRQFLVEPGAFL